MSELLYSTVSEFRGQYPSVPFAPDIDPAEFNAEDDMFVTLPILRVGATSQKGLHWTPEAVHRIVNEINTKHVGGNLGHLATHERATRFDLPVAKWVGAVVAEDGYAYAKAFIPKYANAVRDYIRDAKRTNSKIGTSVYGLRGKKGLEDMELESIDFGPPERVSLPEAAAVPLITSEMQDEDTSMSDTNDALVAELRTDRDKQAALVAELQTAAKERETLIAELEQSKTTLEALVSELALGDNPLADAKAIKARLATLAKKELISEIGDVVAELVEVEKLRPYIMEYLVEDTDDGARKALVGSLDEAKLRVEGLLKKEHIQDLAKTLVRELRGPNAFMGKLDDGEPLKDTPEAREAARHWLGV